MNNLVTIPPFDTFVLEKKRGEYKDFELGPDSTYPLKGVTYPVDYGYIPGYIAEDTHKLDLFVGSDMNGLCGTITVWRGDDKPLEHKAFISLTRDELDKILQEFQPVLRGHQVMHSIDELLGYIEHYRKTHL